MKKIVAFLMLLSLIIPAIWQVFFSKYTSWLLVAVCLLLLSILPLFFMFEKSARSSKRMALLSVFIALAVVGRAVFYLVPQVKPIAAVVIIAAVCLGPFDGYIVGTLSVFISNFLFGQGLWTPFQMVAMGILGFLCAIILKNKELTPLKLAIVGFFMATFIYGAIVDFSTVLITVTEFNLKSVLAVYAAGAIFDLSFGISTAVFLAVFGMPFVKKVSRIQTKYGLEYDNAFSLEKKI